MTKNFIEAGGIYKSKGGYTWECICVKLDRAWLVIRGDYDRPACVFKLDGTSVSHQGMKEYQLMPPKPKINKNKATLDRRLDEWFFSVDWDSEGIDGFIYTHPEAKVALFVPENIDGETLAEAIGELQGEIGG